MQEEKTEPECFEILYESFKELSVREMYEKIKLIFVDFSKKEPPASMSKNYTERDYLEVSIIMLEFIHCMIYKIDFITFKDNDEEFDKIEIKNKLLWHLIKLKAEMYGEEIFAELGMKIVGKVGKAYVIIDENNYN